MIEIKFTIDGKIWEMKYFFSRNKDIVTIELFHHNETEAVGSLEIQWDKFNDAMIDLFTIHKKLSS